mmetsp:Transcript_745/g.2135  ORF Transcript_745/g.2135 Transcript_745/m.2135 type:complete len:1529 (-) Transcript_745:194-4780(-)
MGSGSRGIAASPRGVEYSPAISRPADVSDASRKPTSWFRRRKHRTIGCGGDDGCATSLLTAEAIDDKVESPMGALRGAPAGRADGADGAGALDHPPPPSDFAADVTFIEACERGDSKAAMAAIKAGVSVETTGPCGRSALQITVHGLHFDLAVKLVAAAGADVNTARMTVTQANRHYADVTPEGRRKHLNQVTRACIAAMLELFDGELHRLCALGDTDAVRKAITENQDLVDKRNCFGATPFHAACGVGSVEVARVLLEHGADVEAVKLPTMGKDGFEFDSLNDTVPGIMMAAKMGHLEMVEFLLANDIVTANVNAAKLNSSTALFDACHYNHLAVVRILLKSGARIDAARSDGVSPLHIASHFGYVDIVDFLVVASGGAYIENTTDTGDTSLYLATVSGQVNVIEYLLTMAGAALDTQNSQGWTALHVACHHGHTDAVSLLTAAGASVTVTTTDGATALHLAAENGHLAVVEHLVDTAGVNIDASKPTGCTALHLACTGNHMDVARFLCVKRRCQITWPRIKKGCQENLRKIRTERLLNEDGAVKADCPKLFLCGNPGVGKTRLSKSLPRAYTESLFYHSNAPADRTNPDERTPGFAVSRRHVRRGGLFSIWDFAGHTAYCQSHELFFRATGAIFVILVCLHDPYTTQRTQAMHWSRMIASAASGNARPRVVFVGSARDEPHSESGVVFNSAQKRWVSASGQTVLAEAREVFRDQLDILNTFFCLDCRKSRGRDMGKLRVALGELRMAVLNECDQVPRLCARLAARLPEMRKSARVASLSDVVQALRNLGGGPSVTDEKATTVLTYLHDAGDVLFFADNPTLSTTVILDPNWFGGELIGRIFAPSAVNIARPPVLAGGVLRRRDIEVALAAASDDRTVGPDLETALEVLKRLELCVPVNWAGEGDEEEFIFPGLLGGDVPEGVAFHRDKSPEIWVGRRLQCQDFHLTLPTSFLPRLQVRLFRRFDGSVRMWLGGATIKQGLLHACVELSQDRRELDVVVQGPLDDNKRAEACDLMNRLVAEATALRADVCDRMHLEESALSVAALGKGLPQSKRWGYPVDTLRARREEGLNESEVINHDVGSELIRVLLEGGGTTPQPECNVYEWMPGKYGIQPTAVSLRCAVANGDATIRYTLDGSEVTKRSTCHVAGTLLTLDLPPPIRVVEVRVRAFVPGRAPSATTTFQLWAWRPFLPLDDDAVSIVSRMTSHGSCTTINVEPSHPRMEIVIPFSSRAGASDHILRGVMDEIKRVRTRLSHSSAVSYAYDSRLDHDCTTWEELRELLQMIEHSQLDPRKPHYDAGLVMLFLGHGEGGKLTLDNGEGVATQPDIDDLAVKIARCNPACVILNACETEALARLVHFHCCSRGNTEAVVCYWSSKVSNRAAVNFSTNMLTNVVSRLEVGDPGLLQSGRRDLYLTAAADAWSFIRGRMNSHHAAHPTSKSARCVFGVTGIPPVWSYCRYVSNRFHTMPELPESLVREVGCYEDCWDCWRRSGGGQQNVVTVGGASARVDSDHRTEQCRPFSPRPFER